MAADFIGPDTDLAAPQTPGKPEGFVGPDSDTTASFVGPKSDAAQPEDIRGRMQDPKFWPSNDQWRALYESEKNKPSDRLGAVARGLKGIAALPGQAWDEASAEAAQGKPGHFLQREAAVVPEALGQLARMVIDPVADFVLAPPHSTNEEQAFQNWKEEQGNKLARSRMPASAPWTRTWREPVEGEDPEQAAVQPFQAASTIASLGVPIGAATGPALKYLGAAGPAATAGKTLVQSAIEGAAGPATKALGERAAGAVGAAVENTGKLAKVVGGAPRKLINKAAEAITGPEMAKPLAGGIAGALLHNPVAQGLATAEGVGTGVAKAGELIQKVAGASAAGPGRFANLLKNPATPTWIRGTIGSLTAGAAGIVVPAAKSIVKGAVGGAAVGAGLNAANGEDPWEGAGAGLALGGGFGLAGAGEVRKGDVFKNRVAGLTELMRSNLDAGVTPETLAKVPDAAALAASDLPYLGIKDAQGRDLKVRFADEKTDTSLAGQDGYYDRGQHTIVMNADALQRSPAAWGSLFHEVLHPLMESEVANRPELKGQVDAALAKNGQTLDEAKRAYASAHLAEQLKGSTPEAAKATIDQWVTAQDQASAVNNKGDANHWVYSELLAEAGRCALGGLGDIVRPEGAINRALAPSVSKILGNVLERMGIGSRPGPKPGTVIPGFQNVAEDPSLRKAVYSLLRNQRDFAPGISKGAPQEVRLTPQDVGGAKLPVSGQTAQDYLRETRPGSGRYEVRPKAEQRKAERDRKAVMERIFPTTGTALPANDASDAMALRTRADGSAERRGRVLGDAFYQDPNVSDSMKQTAAIFEAMINKGGAFEGWYNKTHKNGIASLKDLVSEYKRGVRPYEFFMDKHGHLLVRSFDMGHAEDVKLGEWAQRTGPVSLELWGNDPAAAKVDLVTYTDNLASGRPGADSIGEKKRDVLNALVFGDNAANRDANPLRKNLKSAKAREGLVRSYRIDRVETAKPSPSDLHTPDYRRGVFNFSPSADPRAVKLAAVMDESTGKIYEGPYHAAAAEKYWETKFPGDETNALRAWNSVPELKEGFITNSGEFLDRDQAFQRATELNQYKPTARDDGQLESTRFNHQRELQAAGFAPDVRYSPAAEDKVAQVGQNIVDQAGEERRFSPATKFVDNQPSDVNNRGVKKLPHAVGEGSVRVIHLSSRGDLKTVNPRYFGKGAANTTDLRGGNKSFFFVEGSPLGADANIFSQGGYNAFTAELDGSKLYDLRAGKPDPLGYYSGVNREKADDLVRRKGYHGILVETGKGDGRNVVLMYRAVPVKPAGNFYGDVARPLATQAKSGLTFKDFFSQATKGAVGKSTVPWEPIMDLGGDKAFRAEQAKHTGNFDEHIAKSIPGFRETQVRTGSAIVKTFGKGADMLDIAASEGSYAKTISARSNGSIKTVSLDPNPDMAQFFAKQSKVPGANYDTSAFLQGFEDNGKVVPAYNPTKRFDVVHESMGFQFISPDREPQFAEAKRLMKPDGVFLTEEKVRNGAWAANEAKKDAGYKAKFFTGEELAKKNEVVGFQQSEQETQKVGMLDNMVTDVDLEAALAKNFKHVVQYWDSGNFRGYAASDNPAVLAKLVKNMGDLRTDYSTVETPRTVGEKPEGKQFSPAHADYKGEGEGEAARPEQFHAVGSFDKLGKLTAALNPSGGYASENENAGGRAPWRYDAGTKAVSWPSGLPATSKRNAVAAWLKERGYPVETHTRAATDFAYSPSAAAGKFQDAIGSIAEDGEVKGVTNSGGDFLSHAANAVTGDNSWRYDAASKTVGWWAGLPNAKTQDIVKAWLEKKGFAVEHQKAVGYNAGSHFAFSPAAPVFYSQLEKTVDAKFSGKEMPAAQLAALLRNPQNGVKAEELKWSGLDDYLKSKGRVTKAEVQEFLKANAVQVKEVQKGTNPEHEAAEKAAEDIRVEMDRKYGPNWYYDDRFINSPDRARLREADERLHDAQTMGKTDTKFENYQLPGGENYRELLFTLPEQGKLVYTKENVIPEEGPETNSRYNHLFWFFRTPDNVLQISKSKHPSQEAALDYILREKQPATRYEHNFKSPHWDEPNVLAHTRLNDRTDSAGKPGLFCEEIQSDWHQKGRKEGYRVNLTPEQQELDALVKRISLNGWESLTREERARKHELVRSGVGESLMGKSGNEGVPDAPFKGTWQELVFRRLVRMAAEQGKDWLGWTTGDQQAERYDLSKQVDAVDVHLMPNDDNRGKYLVEAIQGRNAVVSERCEDLAAVERLIGKDLAKQVAEQKEPFHKYTGTDLKVGGEGMKGFYDKMLVDYANKFGKKFGAKVEDRNIPSTSHGQSYYAEQNPEGNWTVYENTSSGPAAYDDAPTKQAADRILKKLLGTQTIIHSLPITPEMKASVVGQGVQMFSPAAEKAPEQGRLDLGLPSFSNVGGMTKAQIVERFPEAVKAGARDEKHDYNIVGAPLVKGLPHDQAVKTYADKLEGEAKKWLDHPAFQSGLRWYSEFTPLLKKHFGKDANLMAELLAATSKRTNPAVNFGFAQDALELNRRGHYKKLVAKFEQGVKMAENGTLERWYKTRLTKGLVDNPPKVAGPGTWLGHWVKAHDLFPRQSNGKLFGMSSGAVLQVLARRWLELNKGPKVANFVKNLLGTGHEATVDVWSARDLRRLGYEGQPGHEKWRILPMNETGVSDADFTFSQKVFRQAATQMGLKPDALQGGMWFAEKSRWEDNGWAPLDLGDYRKEIKKTGLLRAGVGQRLATHAQEVKSNRAAHPEQALLFNR
jgi:SAM-dependent methyltransferase